MRKDRIELTDTPMPMIMKMSDGNPGAVNVLCRMLKEGEAIDRDSALGGYGALLGMDTHGIYGSRI
ncbi:MAG: hypothetical protein WA003_15700 [Desulfuromonadaceae bacterium]